MAVTGVVGRKLMSPRKRRDQLDQWEIRRRLDGIKAVTERTMRQIRENAHRERVSNFLPPNDWKELTLSFQDKVFAFRLWIELNVQLMR